ncbi:MAG: hypothetical protein KDB21_03205 [Acidimicrobiales bacterium]|nr:hypothetical protein [Acidimicrobiales bacterium]
MQGKPAAKARLRDIAAELGIELRRRWFVVSSAEGLVEGSQVVARLDNRPQGVGEGWVATYDSLHDRVRNRYGVIDDRSGWGVSVESQHRALGAGVRILPTSTPPGERDDRHLLLTGDDSFDAGIKVTTTNPDRARQLLDHATRATIADFFDAGTWAIVEDERIRLTTDLPVRAAASQIRNAAIMSAVLSARVAELDGGS